MSTIFDTAISSINAIKMMIDHTVKKINDPHKNNSNKRIFIENTINDSKPSMTSLKVKEIYDDYNDFIIDEKRQTDAQINNEEHKIEQFLKLEDLLCEKSNIFSELINDLYDQLRKEFLLDYNNTMTENIKLKLNDITFAIKDFDKKLSFLETEIKESIINNIKRANQLIDAIHDITIDIRYFPIARMHDEINGLIEKREKLVDELNILVGVKVVKNDENYAVYLNNGISLIDNNHKQSLIPLISKYDNKYISVGYTDNYRTLPKKIENMIPGAILGSLLEFRKEELVHARNKIGQLIVDFADSINKYDTSGKTMPENDAKNIFYVSPPEVIQSSTNTSSTQTFIRWKDTSHPQDTDYVIYFKNNLWTVTRMSDHSLVEYRISKQNDITSIDFDGMQLFIKGEHADGDIYMVKPYYKTLESFKLLIDQNTALVFSIEDDLNNNINNKKMKQVYKNSLVNRQIKLDQSYQKFSKSISYRYHLLEDNLPFKKNIIKILDNKKMNASNDITADFNELNYEQACYLANVKVLETAEKIFNEIIDAYS